MNGMTEVLSVDVSNSSDATYSCMALTITTSAPFNSDTVYYLMAEPGVCACVCVRPWLVIWHKA